MAKIQLKGLDGLKGLSGSEYRTWRAAQVAAGKITNSTPYAQEEMLYNNQQYVAKYGMDAFKSKSYEERMAQWDYDIVQPAFYQAFNPFFDDDENSTGPNGELYDASKGMGRDFFKYNLMSTEAKRELLESYWKTPTEIDSYINSIQSTRRANTQNLINSSVGAPSYSQAAMGGLAFFQETIQNPIEEAWDRGHNDKLIEGIWAKDLKKKTQELAPIVDQFYTENISNLSDDEVKSSFMKAIKPNEGEGAAYIYSAYFNDNGIPSEDEVKNFSIDDMRHFLARKAVYDYYLGSEAGYDALNNQGKEYINDHQSWLDYSLLLGKDILISTASYTADKWNAMRRMTLLGRDSNVFLTNDGQVVPTADVKSDGNQYYYEVDGQRVPVHQQTLSLTALDDMGKDGNGNDRGWWNNAQFWTNAEQFGTMDENEQAQYRKLGYSPYKVVYKPGDETDLFYETAKMSSFALADVAASFIPTAGAAKAAAMMDKATRMTGIASKALATTGKALYLGSVGAQRAQGTIGAFGIGNAYGRGVFGETFAGNLQQLEQSVADQAQQEVYNQYNSSSAFKAQVDAEIEQRYQELAAQQQQQIQLSEGQMRILDPKANEEALRSRAMQEVLSRKTQEWEDNYKNSDTYGKAVQEAAESASTAALTASITTGIKYTFVNNWGYRQHLFKSRAQRASAAQKEATSGVTEAVNSSGNKRLKSKFDFSTATDRAKQVGKLIGSQAWGGAWTNATDELQSAGGRKMNEDRMSQFISGMYNGRALDTRYSILDGVASYVYGASAGLAAENTYKAGLVGGLGSIASIAPNSMSIAPLIASGKSRKAFMAELREHRKNKDYMAIANMFVTNGVLNEYYSKKQGQLQLMAKVDLVNRMLDQTNDFEAIDQAIALDMASIDATNPEDANALSFLKAVQAIDMLNKFKEDKEAAQVGQESTVMQKAMTAIEKLSDPSKLTQEEAADYLSQYYAANPTIAQSEGQNTVAFQEMQENARRLQKASETWGEVEDTLSKVENSRGTAIPSSVRGRLLQRLTLDKFLTDRTSELEEKITGTSTPSDAESTIASYGTREHQESQVRATENLIKGIEKEISHAEDRVEAAQRDMDNYNSTPQNDQGFVKKNQLQRALDNAKIQVAHLNNIKRGLTLQLDRFSEQVADMWNAEGNVIGTRTQAKVTEQVLTADEILRLNPQDRARMLDKANYDKYSDAQKAEIDKLTNQLTVKDPLLLDDIQNQANLTQRIEANRRAYAMMLENPEAAAYQLESDMNKQAIEARAVHMDRMVTKIADAMYKAFQQGQYGGEDINSIRNSIYKNLRVLNRDILDYMNDVDVANSLNLGFMFKEIQDAIDWSDMTTDMSHIIDSMEMEDAPKKAFTDSLDAMLEKTKSRAEVLDELGKVIESSGVEASAKVPYENLLNELEQLWNQRASTTSMTREERKAAQEEHERKLAEEGKRKKDAEEAARIEAERRAVEAAAAGITEADADTSNDRAAELEAQGLSEKDTTTDNEGTLTPEQIAQAVEEGEDVDLESPTLDEQAATEPDKVDIRPAPVDDNTDQGNAPLESTDNFLGNTMYGYEINPLKFHGKQVVRRGKDANDKMSKFFDWMDAAGIKLQDIIDNELGDIMKLNPDVFPLYADYHRNATNDDALSDFMLLAVEYTSSIQGIHNDALGGVVTANGKQYLIIGTMGFAPGNRAQGNAYRQHLYEGKVARKKYFDANPSERFFVDTSRHTQIQNVTSGRLVRQLATDAEVEIRSVSELLADKARNPKGLTMGDLKWGIQYDNRLATVNVSERNTVYPPSDGASNLGSVFLLVETANGNYIPAYIRPMRLSELKDGKLKTQLNDLINELTSTDHARRLASIKQLVQFLNLTQEGDNILIGTTEKPTVSIVKGGAVIRTFNLTDANFDRTAFLESVKELDPRVNITTSTLSDVSSLEMFDEAGALTTDLAKLGTSGASYNVYAMDAEGNPIITAPAESVEPTLEAGSDLAKAERKRTKSVQLGSEVYREWDGQWHTSTDRVVTDPRLIEQLTYNQIIRSRNLEPDKVVGANELFILNTDRNNPVVVSRKAGTSLIVPLSKESALRYIDQINSERAEQVREQRVQQELETLKNLTDEQVARAIDNDAYVDMGEETLTDEQIVEQMTGNFEAEATPQQKTAEELVEKITSDTADIQLSEDGATYVDGSGKHYARVTSVIAADEFSDGRFEADNPWGLPSTTIGTGIDEFVRDFFDNKIGNRDNLADRYPNASNEQLQEFAKQLDGLKESFRRRGLTIVPRDVTVTGTVEVRTKSGDRRVLDVAGTLDLLAYDKDGNFYIFDMKTNKSVPRGESGRKKGAKWSKQLTLYKQLLQEKYGAVVKGLETIPIQVDYPAPKGWGNATTEYSKRGGQLYADGKEYRMAEPILHDNIPLPETALQINYSKLTPAEQAMVRTVEDVAPTRDKEAPVVQSEPVKTGEDINKTGTKSLAELQSEKTVDTALSIMKSKEYGKRARALLKAKFPDMPSKTAELERFLQSKGIATTGITDVEQWLKMIEECK